jgi:hypothetical protein
VDEEKCFNFTGQQEACIMNGQTYEFFQMDFGSGQNLWIAGDYLDVGPQRRCGNELRVIVLGDWGERLLPGQDQVAAGMANWSTVHNPDWIVTTGDNIYPKGLFSWDDPQMDIKWREVYYQDSICNLTWYVCVGNHDFGEGGNEWNQVELSLHEPRWILPHLWHDFVEEMADHSVHFVIIDTESFRWKINDYEVMLDWFEETLSQSTADWLLVIGHRYVFTAGDHLYGPVTDEIYDELVPVMLKYGVDAYVCGHDHNLQHLQNMTAPDNTMQYILSGAGGALPNRYIPDNEDYIREYYNVQLSFFKQTFGFVTLTTSLDRLRWDFFDQDAVLLYSYSQTPMTSTSERRQRQQ